MMYNKGCTTIPQQIQQLENRGLEISDKALAESYLNNISYYRLAGYWWPLQSDKVNHIFKPGSKFETVIKIYNFDRELRVLLFDVMEKIEIAFRTKLAYNLSHEFSPWWFEDSTIFQNSGAFNGNLSSIDRELQRNKNKEVFLSEHYKKYNSDVRRPPAWKTLEVVSFGVLSKIYGNLKNTCKSKDQIAAELGTVNFTYLHSWLQSITQIRNICAHHGRIWNKNLPGRPRMMPKPPRIWLANTPPVQEHHMLYVHLCCLKYLLNVIIPGNTFTSRLYYLLKKYPNIDLNALGMPKDWMNDRMWNHKINYHEETTTLHVKAFLFNLKNFFK